MNAKKLLMHHVKLEGFNKMDSFSTNYYKKPPKKNNRRTKALLILFLSTFAIVMFFSLYVASIVTPKIDIPALSKDDENAEQDFSGSQFKGIIDPRLKYIEMEEQTPEQPKQELKNSLVNESETEIEAPVTYQGTPTDDADDENEYTNPYSPPKTATPKPAAKSGQESVALRNKVANAPPKMARVLVGKYSSPYEAREAANMFMNSNYTPFIKEHNGSYSLQVGSYTDMGKAADTANTLKNRGFSVQIIQEN